jgi:hypothetical protein
MAIRNRAPTTIRTAGLIAAALVGLTGAMDTAHASPGCTSIRSGNFYVPANGINNVASRGPFAAGDVIVGSILSSGNLSNTAVLSDHSILVFLTSNTAASFTYTVPSATSDVLMIAGSEFNGRPTTLTYSCTSSGP